MMKYTILTHDKCGWASKPMDKKALENFGVPWYCGNCGMQIKRFVKGTMDEVIEWKKERAALKGDE